ncbi:acyl-CoA thioesterase [Lutibacter sp.]|uniref:acyl-CoA thioesterase n=1 Tax=Lutibacter sp. TaxID=1925666 RepID=UPI0034A090B6
MKKHFSYSFKVDQNSIDDLNHVNNVIYLDWAQKIAEMHWSHISEELANNNYVWVVKRHEIDYFLPVFFNDEITLNTYIGSSYGVKSERFVTIIKEGKTVCSVKTIWCLLDKFSMKLTRIPSEILLLLDSNKI